jgi:hypothetical protein
VSLLLLFRPVVTDTPQVASSIFAVRPGAVAPVAESSGKVPADASDKVPKGS